ncbi:MAG: hypothetical protein AAGF32_04260 [Pseudomonadota bacterium]
MIDRDLLGNWDFRDVAFSGCFEQPQCVALGLTITAERRGNDGETWVPALLYWDPVDGIGVMAGAQNDEIDFDERVLVTFEGMKGGTASVDRIWLSDLFIGEDQRYGSRDPAGSEDVEVAVIQSSRAGSILNERLVDGADVLPPDPFNAEVGAGFVESADLLRRIVIQDGMITVVIPSADPSAEPRLLSVPLSEIDEEKLALFEDIETVEIELGDILPRFNEAPFNAAGTTNAQLIEQLLTDLAELQNIRQQAEETRLVSSVSNGELGVEMDETLNVDELIFMSVLGGSNDYSVAGIILASPDAP